MVLLFTIYIERFVTTPHILEHRPIWSVFYSFQRIKKIKSGFNLSQTYYRQSTLNLQYYDYAYIRLLRVNKGWDSIFHRLFPTTSISLAYIRKIRGKIKEAEISQPHLFNVSSGFFLSFTINLPPSPR